MNGSDTDRFWSMVAKGPDGSCWLWTASVQVRRGGYGQFKVGGKTRRTHIVAYELIVGAIPNGKVLDHLCRTPRCVNPAHLDPVTHGENTRRGMAPSAIAYRTNRCQRGHAFTEANTIRRPNRPGKRECRTCDNARQRLHHAATRRVG